MRPKSLFKTVFASALDFSSAKVGLEAAAENFPLALLFLCLTLHLTLLSRHDIILQFLLYSLM
jgi:hypothetical protein